MVRRTVLMIGTAIVLAGTSGSAQHRLADRIAHTDPSKYVHNERRHEGAAAGMDVMTLIDNDQMKTNLLYMFRSVISPRRHRPPLPHARGRDVRDLRQRGDHHRWTHIAPDRSH